MHVGMKRQGRKVHDNQQGVEPLDAVYAVGEHHGAPRVLEQEVIEVEVLLVLLTVDLCLGQGLHSCLLPGQVNDFGFGPHTDSLHENVQPASLLHVPLLLILLQDARGQAVGHGQGGREHKDLPRGIEVHGVQHLQQALQLCKVAPFHHTIGFINDEAPAE